MEEEQNTKARMTKGGKNLAILGVISVLIAVATSGVSLAIYHNSGDIYLDRSRPGFLPDEKEIEDENGKKEDYVFEKSGKITMDTVEEYLEKLQKEIKNVDSYENPFDSDVLSDKKLGIPTEETGE